ncbi:beta-ketoacyl synthase chain length factor [Guyparkeria hydrothermalis]|uniref:beta-ketoacyl synthase chain length factor n=1 Tax=Guyparkeria hydrothermalis TaxID=923 RepID=UPI0020201D3C|nr:beta-ketoacyl synthase chain length factor [Guyparkeria hydrothermalis]MCL7743807.1 beta-ketoacyl synthase chain length factor [Guyparkeria hydrothermalis]
MKLSIEGVGFVGAGLADWQAAVEALRADTSPGSLPLAELGRALKADRLPRTERRRAGKSVRLSMTACWEAVESAGLDPADLPMVFASTSGDTEVLSHICAALAEPERMVSPTRFHNSVHNAASGYWSIAVGTHQPATAIAAHHETAAAGLLEAAMQAVSENRPVLLVIYDIPFPEPMNQAEPIAEPLAVALVLRPASADSSNRLNLSLSGEHRDATSMQAEQWLALWEGVPAGRILPLLEAVARDEAREIAMPTGDGPTLVVDYEPMQRGEQA